MRLTAGRRTRCATGCLSESDVLFECVQKTAASRFDFAESKLEVPGVPGIGDGLAGAAGVVEQQMQFPVGIKQKGLIYFQSSSRCSFPSGSPPNIRSILRMLA